MKKKIFAIRSQFWWRYLYSAVLVTISALIQTFALQAMIRPAHMLSSGFTGLAILVHEIGGVYNINIPVSLMIVLLNLPVAFLCSKTISWKFTLFSSIQFILTSVFLNLFHFTPLFEDILLNAIIGGVVYGFSIVVALVGNASTGGTDFIALYVSNKTGKGIWTYVFIYNCILLSIFGFMFGWNRACYSIILQFVSTKMIDSLYHRYERSTIQVTTIYPEEIIKEYTSHYRHGISAWQSYGGYSHKTYFMLNTVVSSYEVKEIAHLILRVDPRAIINVYKTDDFFGGFYRKPID